MKFRDNSYDIRQKILNISYVDWSKLGFLKYTALYEVECQVR